MACKVSHRFIADDPAARNILVLRFHFAPCRQRFQPPQHRRVTPGGADAVPGDFEVVGVVFRIGQLFHLGIQPVAAPGFDQALQNLGEDRGKVGHIADGIFDLAFGKRAAAPIGEPCALVDGFAEPAFDQIGIADLFGLADRHHRDLRVEDRKRGLAGQVVDDFHILPAGMKHLQHILVLAHQIEQRGHVEAGRQRINRSGFFFVADLDQAQQRVICVLAHELGVHAHNIVLRQPVAQFGEGLGIGNQGMNQHFHSFRLAGSPTLGLLPSLTKWRACPVSARNTGGFARDAP